MPLVGDSEVAKADVEERQGQRVSALLAYLDAKEKYPASYFADEGIVRLTSAILDNRAGGGGFGKAAGGTADTAMASGAATK
jgi:hypothetical protein